MTNKVDVQPGTLARTTWKTVKDLKKRMAPETREWRRAAHPTGSFPIVEGEAS